MAKANIEEMRRKLAEREAEKLKPQNFVALQTHEATEPELTPFEDEGVAEREQVRGPAEQEQEEASPPVEPKATKPAKASTKPAAKVEKKSTSLYLTPAAHRALNMIAAKRGDRPHRVVDEGLRYVFKKEGLDFDALNSTSS